MAVRIGVIGAGFYGRFHLDAWRSLAHSGVVIAAVCDADASRADAALEEFGAAAAYVDPAQMIADEELDLVDIATRMDSHRALVGLTIGAGIATVVQKPMAPTFEEASAMVAAAENAGVFFAVHENFRFQRRMLRLAEIIKSGEIGRPTWARISVRAGRQVYEKQPYFYEEQRLVLLDLGVHLVDLARVFVGEVARVSCEVQRRNERVSGEDTASMLLRHENQAVTIVECTYENRRANQFHLAVEIEGDAGGITVLPSGQIEIISGKGLRVEPEPATAVPRDAPKLQHARESVYLTCRHMLECLTSNTTPVTSGADNLKTLAIVEAAYEAARLNSGVELNQ